VALADQALVPDVKTAQIQIRQDLSRIRDVFVNLGEKLDLIDRFSHKLERRIATTVRYQETARNVREESLRNAIRLAFARLDAGETTCISPLAGLPLAYSTATLAIPKQAREPVQPQKRLPKTVDPADLMREAMIDNYVAVMAVTPSVVAARLWAIAGSEAFVDLDAFAPENARDVAILYEARSGAFDELPSLEIRRGDFDQENRFVTGPSILIRRRGDKR
jgi:hypothetical protein